MRHIAFKGGVRVTSWAIALAFISASAASAQSRVVLPAGSVVIVRTTGPLESASAQTGQTFETDVEESVGVDEYTVIPAGSRIRGVITLSRPATQQQSGVIEVVFDRLTLADGSYLPIRGKLTSTDSAERRQIKSNPSARVVFVGGRGGIGAAIAGAGSGRTTNNILAALGGLLSEGRDVSVPAGDAPGGRARDGADVAGARKAWCRRIDDLHGSRAHPLSAAGTCTTELLPRTYQRTTR